MSVLGNLKDKIQNKIKDHNGTKEYEKREAEIFSSYFKITTAIRHLRLTK